jgi:hypothetical protein
VKGMLTALVVAVGVFAGLWAFKRFENRSTTLQTGTTTQAPSGSTLSIADQLEQEGSLS